MSDDNTTLLIAGGVVAGGLWWASRDGSAGAGQEQSAPPDGQQQGQGGDPNDSRDSWQAATSDGEVGVDTQTGVVYDDPESGPANDEAADDVNVSFDQLEGVDGTSYAPDTIQGVDAPSGGKLADPGTSQQWGDATEQDNDDLSERSATSNMSDSLKAMFDRMANLDDPAELSGGA